MTNMRGIFLYKPALSPKNVCQYNMLRALLLTEYYWRKILSQGRSSWRQDY